MPVSHKDLPNSELHEPKGVSGASVDQVYVANGSGSGAWKAAPYTYALTIELDDVSTASSAFVVVPKAGTIKTIRAVLHSAITTADAVLTFAIGATAITTTAITVEYTSSSAGDSYLTTPTADNQVLAGSVLKVTTDGASDTAARVTVTFEVQVGYTA